MFRYNDEELLYLSRQGCKIAYTTLVDEYYQYIKLMLYKMKIMNRTIDENDIIQLAMLHCIGAFDKYRPDRNSKLRTFMSWVIRNSILTSLKRVGNEQYRYYMYSLDEIREDTNGVSYENIIQDKDDTYQPRERLVVKETVAQYQGYVDAHCSTLEQQVLKYRLQGYATLEIAEALQVEVKAVYNAVYRLQKKLENVS